MNETWKPIPGYDGLYEASSFGQIQSVTRTMTTYSARAGMVVPLRREGVLMAQHPNVHGYMTVCLSREGKSTTKRVAPLVCAAFHGPRLGAQQACHNNGVKTDDRAENLRWDSAKANQADRILHGTTLRGAAVVTAKFTAEDIAAIRASRSFDSFVGVPVSKTHYYRIKKGESWAHTK